jgi:hypothetical protein
MTKAGQKTDRREMLPLLEQEARSARKMAPVRPSIHRQSTSLTALSTNIGSLFEPPCRNSGETSQKQTPDLHFRPASQFLSASSSNFTGSGTSVARRGRSS